MNVKNAAVNPRTTAHVQIWFSAVDSDSGRRARGTHERAEALTEGPEEACFGTLAAQSITLDGCRAVSQRHWEAHRASLSDSREHSMESMTYEMAEALSAAKLESAMVDAGPQKLHDGAAVGRTSTKNPEEPKKCHSAGIAVRTIDPRPPEQASWENGRLRPVSRVSMKPWDMRMARGWLGNAAG